MQDNYNFDSLNTSKKALSKKRPSIKIALTNAQLIVLLISIVTIIVGFRWRLSFGGKLMIITGISCLLIVVLNLFNYEVKRIHKILALGSVTLSIIIGLNGYLRNSYKDLRFTQDSVNRTVNDTGNLYLGNEEKIDISKVKFISSNEKVAALNSFTNEFLCLSEGSTTFSVLDLYGHRSDAIITCSENSDGFIKSTIRSYVIQGEEAHFSVSSSGNYNPSLLEYYEEDDNLIIQGSSVIGAKLGTTWFRHRHEDQGPVATEITVLKRGAFVFDVNFGDYYYGYGDQIPLDKLLNENAKGKEITVTNKSEGLIIKDGMVSFEDYGTLQGDFTYDGITESVNITIATDSLQAVYLPQVEYETLYINEVTPLELVAIPSYSNMDGIRLISMDDSIVRIEEGNIIPVSKGETEIIITKSNVKKSFKVINE